MEDLMTYAMKISDLKESIKNMPDDYYVVLPSHVGTSPMSKDDAFSLGTYVPENTYMGEFYQERDYEDEEVLERLEEDSIDPKINAVKLYPIV